MFIGIIAVYSVATHQPSFKELFSLDKNNFLLKLLFCVLGNVNKWAKNLKLSKGCEYLLVDGLVTALSMCQNDNQSVYEYWSDFPHQMSLTLLNEWNVYIGSLSLPLLNSIMCFPYISVICFNLVTRRFVPSAMDAMALEQNNYRKVLW